MANIVRTAAAGSILLLPSGIVLAGHHLFKHQPDRPIVSPACDPAWGYSATCWNRFPPMAGCEQWTSAGYIGNAGTVVSPGTSLPMQGSAPISILPDRGQGQGQGQGVIVPGSPQQPAAVPHPGVQDSSMPHSGNSQFPLPPLPSSPQPRYEYEPPVEGQALPDPGAQSQSRYRFPAGPAALIPEPSGIILPEQMIRSGRYGSVVSPAAH